MLSAPLLSLPEPMESKHIYTNKLCDLLKSAFTSYAKDEEKKVKATIFDTLWNNLVANKNKPIEFINTIPSLNKYNKIILQQIPVLYQIAYVLDLIEIINAKHTETTRFKGNLLCSKQGLQRTVVDIISWANEHYTLLEKKIIQHQQTSRKKISEYKTQLNENAALQKTRAEYEKHCKNDLDVLSIKLNSAKKEFSDFKNRLDKTTDDEFSSVALLVKLKTLENEIKKNQLPPTPELKGLYNRPDIIADNNRLFLEFRNFAKNYQGRITAAQKEYKKIDVTLQIVKSDLILNKDEILILSEFLANFSPTNFKSIRDTILAAIYKQHSYLFYLPEWSNVTTFTNELFGLLEKIEPDEIKTTISDDLRARNALVIEEKKDTSSIHRALANETKSDQAKSRDSHDISFADLERDLHKKNQDLTIIAHEMAASYDGTKPKHRLASETKKSEAPIGMRAELEKIEEDVVGQFVSLRASQEKAKNHIASECKELISELETINISAIIRSNKEREQKEAQEKAKVEYEAKQLVDEIRFHTSQLESPRETKHQTSELKDVATYKKPPSSGLKKTDIELQPLLASTPSRSSSSSIITFLKVKKFNPSSYKHYLGTGITSGIAGLSTTIAAIAIIASNPAGWAIGLLIAGVALLAGATALLKKAHSHYKKKVILEKLHDDKERQFSQIQNDVLEKKGNYPSTSLRVLQKFGVKLTTPSQDGNILCQLGKQQELKLGPNPPQLFFNNKTGELYFKKMIKTGFEKIRVQEDQDFSQLIKQLR